MMLMRLISWIGLLIAAIEMGMLMLGLFPPMKPGAFEFLAALSLAGILACCSGMLWVLTEVHHYGKPQKK